MDIQGILHATQWDHLPLGVQRQVKLCLLDLIGVGFGGIKTPLAQIICDHAAMDYAGSIPMLFDGRPASPLGVALAGGMTIDALDGHNGYNPAKGHAGCGLLPALYAAYAEAGQNSGRGFLTDLALGYELACRVAVSQHETCPDYHTSGAWVAVGIAGVLARFYGLDADQTAHALGIAEYHGPRSQMMRCIDHPTMLKDGSGWGAMTGLSAARLARSGFTGAPALTMDTPHWNDLGLRWLILEQYFKPYPVCRWAQGPIEAALTLKRTHGIDPATITKIEVTTFHESVRLGQKDVHTTEEAQYSTSFPVAVALVHDTVGADHIMGDALFDPRVRDLSSKLSMGEDDYANQHFPDRRYAKVALTLETGDCFTSDWPAIGQSRFGGHMTPPHHRI